jgi:hypothetical protein
MTCQKGDFRMTFGENPRKIQNIISSQLQSLQALYHPSLSVLKNVDAPAFSEDPSVMMKQDMDPKVRAAMLMELPKRPRILISEYHQRNKTEDFKLGESPRL